MPAVPGPRHRAGKGGRGDTGAALVLAQGHQNIVGRGEQLRLMVEQELLRGGELMDGDRLQPTKDAVIRVGALLIVMVEWTVYHEPSTGSSRSTISAPARSSSSSTASRTCRWTDSSARSIGARHRPPQPGHQHFENGELSRRQREGHAAPARLTALLACSRAPPSSQIRATVDFPATCCLPRP
jgi:hypothetical protein